MNIFFATFYFHYLVTCSFFAVIENVEKMMSSSTNCSAHTTFQCRSIRVGAHKLTAVDAIKELCVHMSHFGIFFTVVKSTLKLLK